MSAKLQPPESPAHYWQIAAAALAEEQRDRLQAMHDIDGLLALNRLTMYRRNTLGNLRETESHTSLTTRLFAKAYATRALLDSAPSS